MDTEKVWTGTTSFKAVGSATSTKVWLKQYTLHPAVTTPYQHKRDQKISKRYRWTSGYRGSI